MDKKINQYQGNKRISSTNPMKGYGFNLLKNGFTNQNQSSNNSIFTISSYNSNLDFEGVSLYSNNSDDVDSKLKL